MTANQMSVAVGQRVQLRTGSLRVDCTVLDAKTAWGNVRLLVEPVAGTGQQWVELNSITVASEAGLIPLSR